MNLTGMKRTGTLQCVKRNWNEKQKKCYFSYEERKSLLEAIRYVDLVIPEESWEQKISDVKEFKVDTFVIGDDWEGKFDFLKEYCDVVYLPRTPEISTTQIKKDLGKKQELKDEDYKENSEKEEKTDSEIL